MNFLLSLFKRMTTAITSPFRRILLSFRRLFNVNVWSAKLVRPLTKWVKSTLTLKPKSKDDYYTVGKFLVFKKIFLFIVLVVCAGIFLYFTMFADPVQPPPSTATAVITSETFDYDDMAIKDFSGIANIRSSTGEIVYTGGIELGVVQGNGILLDRKGNKVYEGEFAQSMYEGEGTRYYENGTIEYMGQFSGNTFNGEGTKYYSDGTIQYAGLFVDGEFSGEGAYYDRDSTLIYTGNFANGMFHGIGTGYYSDGTRQYEGEYFEGVIQGQGTLYSTSGNPVYTGAMHDGNIDFRSLVNSNLEMVEQAFSETPIIVYTDTDSVFLYEQAGVVITLDARVHVQTTVNTAVQEETEKQYYYLPSSLNGTTDISELYSAFQSSREQTFAFLETNDEWFYPDGTESGDLSQPDSSSDSQSVDSSSSVSSDASSSSSETSSSTTSSTSSSSSSQSTSTILPQTNIFGPQNGSESEEGAFDFIDAQKTLYFEIDSDVWVEYSELEESGKDKVRVESITMFKGDMPDISSYSQDLFVDNSGTAISDCVAIDSLRLQLPTMFSNIIFQMDKSNTSFVELKNVDYAGRIVKIARYDEGLTYRYCYELDNSEKIQYFTVER